MPIMATPKYIDGDHSCFYHYTLFFSTFFFQFPFSSFLTHPLLHHSSHLPLFSSFSSHHSFISLPPALPPMFTLLYSHSFPKPCLSFSPFSLMPSSLKDFIPHTFISHSFSLSLFLFYSSLSQPSLIDVFLFSLSSSYHSFLNIPLSLLSFFTHVFSLTFLIFLPFLSLPSSLSHPTILTLPFSHSMYLSHLSLFLSVSLSSISYPSFSLLLPFLLLFPPPPLLPLYSHSSSFALFLPFCHHPSSLLPFFSLFMPLSPSHPY